LAQPIAAPPLEARRKGPRLQSRCRQVPVLRRSPLGISRLADNAGKCHFVSDALRCLRRLAIALLASPHYGERGAPRLDIAGYEDSEGYTDALLCDVGYRYRAYIHSLMNARPADRPNSSAEQIAGDEWLKPRRFKNLPARRHDKSTATAFPPGARTVRAAAARMKIRRAQIAVVSET